MSAGTHGSLVAGDSEVPLLLTGVNGVSGSATMPSIVDVAPLCSRVGVGLPGFALGRAAYPPPSPD